MKIFVLHLRTLISTENKPHGLSLPNPKHQTALKRSPSQIETGSTMTSSQGSLDARVLADRNKAVRCKYSKIWIVLVDSGVL